MVKFLDLAKQYSMLKPEIDEAISAVINESAFIGGKYVNVFERHFADYQQTAHCIGVANGTDAIEIALEALHLPAGSEILVPANTFIATSEAVTRCGHKVVFCDCDPETYTISIPDATKRITPDTHAIIPVHLYGHPCDMDKVLDLARRYKLTVIEDCAQAHGAVYKGRKVGGFGDIGTFSFYPGKNLGAYGDGGAIVTNDDGLAGKCRMIANHGRIDKYNHEFEGRNSRLDGIQAAILDVKLTRLDQWIHRRREIAEYYRRTLNNLPELTLPSVKDWAGHVWHLFVIRTAERDALQKHLAEHEIHTGVHYPIALPMLKAYSHLGREKSDLFACSIGSELLSLPMGEHLDDGELEIVVKEIKNYFTR